MNAIADKLAAALLGVAIVAVVSTAVEIAAPESAVRIRAETPHAVPTAVVLRGRQGL